MTTQVRAKSPVRPRVLLVEDHRSARRPRIATIGSRAYDVEVCPNTAAALQIARTSAIAVVVSNIETIGMSGARLFSNLRYFAPCTTRILLRGPARSGDAAAAIDEGQPFRMLAATPAHEYFHDVVQAAVARYQFLTTGTPVLVAVARNRQVLRDGLAPDAVTQVQYRELIDATTGSFLSVDASTDGCVPSWERSGWLLHAACDEVASWPTRSTMLSVAVERDHLAQPFRLMAEIRSALTFSRLPESRLILRLNAQSTPFDGATARSLLLVARLAGISARVHGYVVRAAQPAGFRDEYPNANASIRRIVQHHGFDDAASADGEPISKRPRSAVA